MNNRLKELRKIQKLSQEEFGKRLGVGKAAVSKMELGTYNVTDPMIKLICREFTVNENWLRTGSGEMIKSIPEEDEVAAYVSELLEDNGENPLFTLIKEIMHTYNQLDNKSKTVLNDYIIKLLHNLNSKKEG
jgi:transcriptional regulator with XRE-family HTH domain